MPSSVEGALETCLFCRPADAQVVDLFPLRPLLEVCCRAPPRSPVRVALLPHHNDVLVEEAAVEHFFDVELQPVQVGDVNSVVPIKVDLLFVEPLCKLRHMFHLVPWLVEQLGHYFNRLSVHLAPIVI